MRGLLRIPGGKDPIENTGVHPESYAAAKALLARLNTSAQAAAGLLQKEAEAVGYSRLAQELDVGEPTLQDMVKELSKPGRDPRDELPPPLLRTDVMEMDDLTPGMELRGHRTQRDGLWRLCGHWCASGRAGTHQPDGAAQDRASQRSCARWRRGHRLGAGDKEQRTVLALPCARPCRKRCNFTN